MGFYRKKPVVIEAMQFNGEIEPVIKFCKEAKSVDGDLYLSDTRGNLMVPIGWYITKDKDGEFALYHAKQFEQDYEKV